MALNLDLTQLALLHDLLLAGYKTCEELDAPELILNAIEKLIDKVDDEFESEKKTFENFFNQFQEITAQLDDLESASQIIEQNPNAPINEYN